MEASCIFAIKAVETNVDLGHNTSQSRLELLSTEAVKGSQPVHGVCQTEIKGSRPKPWWRRAGWPVGAVIAAVLTNLTLAINLAIILLVNGKVGFDNGVAKAFDYNCDQVGSISTWVHLGINAISTLLLGASNYCMQILSAPTRKEIDMAHARGKCVDIGISSPCNLAHVATKKRVVWWLLFLSSIPLHLVSNSTFYPTTAANTYDVIFATESFLHEDGYATYNETEFPDLKDVQKNAKSRERLERNACIDAYATWFLSDRRNLVLVVPDNSTGPEGTVKKQIPYTFNLTSSPDWELGPFSWICDASDAETRYNLTEMEPCIEPSEANQRFCPCLEHKVKMHADRWRVSDYDIQYCNSEQVQGLCSLYFSQFMAITVIVCNFGKCLATIFVALHIRDAPLITIGDAIESFLNANDSSTQVANHLYRGRHVPPSRFTDASYKSTDHPERLCNHRTRGEPAWNRRLSPAKVSVRARMWFSSTSGRRWWVWIICFTVSLLAMNSLLLLGIEHVTAITGKSWSFDDYRKMGLGSANSRTLIRSPSLSNSRMFPVLHAFIANSGQVFVSLIYLLFNGILSCMLLSREWAGFAHHRKSLRVSHPKPGQRSTYFLQLPTRYAVPLLVASGLLHWFVSQSIFLVRVVSYDKNGNIVNDAALSTCGYSVFGIFLTISLLACLFIASIILGFRTYKPGMAVARSCSLAISAACHADPGGVDTTAPLKWGVTSGESAKIGRCGFSDRAVRPPKPGIRYRGWRSACWHAK